MTTPSAHANRRLLIVAAAFTAAIAVLLVTQWTRAPMVTELEPTRPPAPGGIWLDATGLMTIPVEGPAWDAMVTSASDLDAAGTADLNVRNNHNTAVLAAALVAVRLQDDQLRDDVLRALRQVIDDTQDVSDLLSVARKLGTYAIAADLIDLPEVDPGLDEEFRSWLRHIRAATPTNSRSSLVSTHETRPNNWGTHAGASRIAASLYLGDRADVDRAARVFAGWLGDRDAYAGFRYGDLDWQCDPQHPVGINPAGCTIDGHDVGGVLPDDQRRGGGFSWPPPQVNYAWGALQGAVVQAELLSRAGHDAWAWGDQALVRAVDWLHTQARFPAEGDDTWIPWLVNHATGRSYPAVTPTHHGKNLGYTDWTHKR